MADEKKELLALDDRLKIALSIGEECLTPEALKSLLENKPNIISYDGFEPSGRMHIAQGILKSINVNKLTKIGVKVVFWVADWFAMMNDKMDGNLERIRQVGEYMIEVWRASGMDLSNVTFLWASEEINKRPNEYWTLVMDIARHNTINRIKKCSTIMGREEGDSMPAAQILYPCMQCADIFFLNVDICQLGMDQRKVNTLALEYCDLAHVKKKRRFKPVILSHHMLMGLKEGQAKMSKSDPDSAIFMEDSEQDVKRKIKQAFCPPQIVENNPILDYCKHIIFQKMPTLTVARNPKYGDASSTTYDSYEKLEADYISGVLHPSDLKPAVADAINSMIQPVREHFQRPDLKKLLENVHRYAKKK